MEIAIAFKLHRVALISTANQLKDNQFLILRLNWKFKILGFMRREEN